jgi:hypothetical protein
VHIVFDFLPVERHDKKYALKNAASKIVVVIGTEFSKP